MTIDAYRLALRDLGLTPIRPSAARHTLHRMEGGDYVRVPDPHELSESERRVMLDLLAARLKTAA